MFIDRSNSVNGPNATYGMVSYARYLVLTRGDVIEGSGGHSISCIFASRTTVADPPLAMRE